MLSVRRLAPKLRPYRLLRGNSSGSVHNVFARAMYGAVAATAVSGQCHWSSCDSEAAEPVVIATSAMQKPMREVVKVENGMLERWRDWFMWHMRVLLRSLFLMLNYSLPMAAAPAAFLACDTEHRQWWWSLLRACIRRAGPCSTKMAQWIATRPDLFDMEAIQELGILQARAYHHRSQATRQLVEDTFGESSRLLELSLNDRDVLGSGSVASVYRGTLTRVVDGQEKQEHVAVKVIHPGVRDSIDADLRVIRSMVNFFTRVLPFDPVSMTDSVEQFASLMHGQLDMRGEAENLRRFRKAFAGNKSITFPEPIEGWVKRDILVETFEEGPLVSDFLPLPPVQNKPKIGSTSDRLALAKIGLEAVLRMVFEYNFVHADLHPGNVIVQGTPGGNGRGLNMCMIDAGITASLHATDRKNFIELFRAVVLNDGRHAGHLIMKRSLYGLDGCLDPEGFEMSLAAVIDDAHKKGLSLGRLGVAELLTRVLGLCYSHRVRLDPTFTQLVLGIVVVDGLGRRLDPDIDILQACGPYVLRAAANLAGGGRL